MISGGNAEPALPTSRPCDHSRTCLRSRSTTIRHRTPEFDSPVRRPLGPLLLLSFLATFGTAVLWNGLAFVARDGYGFDETWNLLLAISNGGIYAIAAFASAPILRRLSARIAPRTVVALVFLLQVLICPAILISDSPVVLFAVAGAMSFLAAFFWPVIEAFVSAGRDPGAMRNAIGWWNTVWMLALGLALVSMAPLLAAGHAVWAIASLGPINLACVVVLYLGVPARVAAHRDHHPDHAAPETYVDLLASNRALLPLAYALIGALSPLMPYLLEDLDAPLAWQTPLTATWMFARVAGIAILRRWSWWHGRWAATLLGGVLLVGGFVAVVAAPNITLDRRGVDRLRTRTGGRVLRRDVLRDAGRRRGRRRREHSRRLDRRRVRHRSRRGTGSAWSSAVAARSSRPASRSPP